MEFDVTFFGYGAALVMLPYVVGTCIGLLLRVFDTVGH